MRLLTCLLLGVLGFVEVLPCTDCHFPKSDRSDGSDEQFCGSCDFDQHTCNWTDISSGSFRWRWEMGNVTSIPGEDHTTGSPFGGMMHVEGSDVSLFSEAKLEVVLPKPTALGCHIIFWYHLHDSAGISSIISLQVVMQSSSKELWRLQKGQTRGWENATVHIGNRPAGSKLLFSVKPSLIGSQNVALDDVCLSDCSEQEVPSGSSQLSCSFEDDACAWFTDEEAPARWRRTDKKTQEGGPGQDHTTGTGFYMIAASSYRTQVPLTSRLLSYPQAAGTARCISFWYHMYGGGAGYLKFLSQHKSGPETIEWMRSGTQGNKWCFVDLRIAETSSPVQFIFEASVDGAYSSIAIDDVVVSEAQNGSCPAEQECTFQGSRCGLLDDITGHFNWTRTMGALSANTTSPAVDHTLGTSHGYYLSAQMWKHQVGHVGRVLTSPSDPTPKSGQCLNFWYHMEGEGVGMLRVYLQKLRSSPVLLWAASGDQGDLWRHARVTVLSDDTPYQVVFEAVAEDGLGLGRDIAIDDLLVLNGPCPPQGFCDFETDLCSWVRVRPASNGRDWDWTSASATNAGRVPPMDHTTNSDLGHYIYYSKQMLMPAATAHLLSEYLKGSTGCLVFWYNIDLFSHLDDVRLSVYVNDSMGLRSVWSERQSQRDVWLEAQLDYEAVGRYQILFEAKAQHSSDVGSIALDDICIKTGVTCADLTATTADPTTKHTTEHTTEPTMELTTEPTSIQESTTDSSFETDLSALGCTFDKHSCDWMQATSDDLNWLLWTGPTSTANTGPTGDHTSGLGHYLYMESSSPSEKGQVAEVTSPLVPPAAHQGYCLTFWFHMFGTTVGTLKVFLQESGSLQRMLVWQRAGTQSDQWQVAHRHVTLQKAHRVVVEASVGGWAGDIALDDISFTPGTCLSSDLCDFEESDCGWTPLVNSSDQWQRSAPASSGLDIQPQFDHTTSTSRGYFFYMNSYSPDASGHSARLASPHFNADKEHCFHFWYYMHGKVGSLRIHQQDAEGRQRLTFSQTGSQGVLWRHGWATLEHMEKPFQIIVEGVRGPDMSGSIAIDDVQLSPGPCLPPGHCNFQTDLCRWTNMGTGDQADWLRGHGSLPTISTGPQVDHTTGSSKGYYMYVDTAVGQPKDRAQLYSEVFQPTETESCFCFWYHTDGQDIGTLSLYSSNSALLEGEEKDLVLLWEETDSETDGWSEVQVSFSSAKPFWLVFVYEKGTGRAGHVALDDTLLTPGACSGLHSTLPSSSAYVGLVMGLLLLITLVSVTAILFKKRTPSTMTLIEEEHDIDMSFIEVCNFKQPSDFSPETPLLIFSPFLQDPSHSFTTQLHLSGTSADYETTSSQA